MALDSGLDELLASALIGEEESSVDIKGRIIVSKKQRDRLGYDFVVTVSEYGCLAAYPEASWRVKVKEIFEVPAGNPYRVEYAMLFLGPAEGQMNFDKQGRVTLPKSLRATAKISERVVIVGVGDRYLIWAKDEYEAYKKDRDGYEREHRKMVLDTYGKMRGQV